MRKLDRKQLFDLAPHFPKAMPEELRLSEKDGVTYVTHPDAPPVMIVDGKVQPVPVEQITKVPRPNRLT